jgi:hypothetical protein
MTMAKRKKKKNIRRNKFAGSKTGAAGAAWGALIAGPFGAVGGYVVGSVMGTILKDTAAATRRQMGKRKKKK